MHRLERPDPVGFSHHAAGADLAGGDQFDVDAGLRQAAKHAGRRSRCAGHACSHGTHPGDRGSFLEAGAAPAGQHRPQGPFGAGAVVTLEGEAHVTAEFRSHPMGALRLNDRVEADAGIRERPADRGCGARPVRHAPHHHLHLVAVKGHAPHGGTVRVAGSGAMPDLMVGQLEGRGGGPQGLAPLTPLHQAAHLHLAGGDQPQVDAQPGQGVEQPGRHPGSAHDPGA